MKLNLPNCVIMFFLLFGLLYHEVLAGEKTECVVLLHGLARTQRSMAKLEHYLKNQGYDVVNIDYPSRHKPIPELSKDTIPESIRQCASYQPDQIHFVTHSMGGILVRFHLAHNNMPELGRVVMLSPPNKGSQIVDKLGDTFIFEWLNGPAGKQLGTNEESIPNSLGPAHYEVGIITGDKTINPILSLLIPGKDDGKVSIENAKLDGMKDFLIVHKTHPFIMRDEEVIQKVATFLEYGVFTPPKR